jgi:hypothetical protein
MILQRGQVFANNVKTFDMQIDFTACSPLIEERSRIFLMKTIIILALLFGSLSSFAKELMCSREVIDQSVAIARQHATFDKNMHCVTSCLIALRCSALATYSIGVGKEIKDIFGPGNAEMADLRADRVGLDLVRSSRVRNRRECLVQCDSYYRRNG